MISWSKNEFFDDITSTIDEMNNIFYENVDFYAVLSCFYHMF
jgi:hypothetical protein